MGRRLLDELRALALREGVDGLSALVAPGNESALALMRRAGRVVHSAYVDGAYELVVELEPLPRAA